MFLLLLAGEIFCESQINKYWRRANAAKAAVFFEQIKQSLQFHFFSR